MTIKIKDVYVVAERGENQKDSWSKIGVAFINRDDSLNVILDAVPLTGKLHIRDRQKLKKEKPYEKNHTHFAGFGQHDSGADEIG